MFYPLAVPPLQKNIPSREYNIMSYTRRALSAIFLYVRTPHAETRTLIGIIYMGSVSVCVCVCVCRKTRGEN